MGTLLGSTPFGFYVANANAGQRFDHPFRPALSAGGLRFRPGRVEGYEPTIEGVPISGSGGKLPPLLGLKTKVYNGSQESWACVEVTPNVDGTVNEKSKIEVVHCKTPFLDRGLVGRFPLALIVWRGELPILVLPQVFFNLRYSCQLGATPSGKRHFFR